MNDVIKDLEKIRWDIHCSCWYDLEEELRLVNSLDKAIRELKTIR